MPPPSTSAPRRPRPSKAAIYKCDGSDTLATQSVTRTCARALPQNSPHRNLRLEGKMVILNKFQIR